MIDFEKIKMLYKLGRNLNLADAQVLIQAAQRKSYAPGEYLISEGGLSKNVFFIRSGLVRGFVVNKRGDEITKMIRREHQIVASTDTILFQQPSESYYEALEPTDVNYLDYDTLQNIIARNPKLEANRKYFFQNILKEALTRIDSFVLLSPEERYLDFIKSNPDLDHRVPDKYIANVLGITPVSLSRIRKRIASKKK